MGKNDVFLELDGEGGKKDLRGEAPHRQYQPLELFWLAAKRNLIEPE